VLQSLAVSTETSYLDCWLPLQNLRFHVSLTCGARGCLSLRFRSQFMMPRPLVCGALDSWLCPYWRNNRSGLLFQLLHTSMCALHVPPQRYHVNHRSKKMLPCEWSSCALWYSVSVHVCADMSICLCLHGDARLGAKQRFVLWKTEHVFLWLVFTISIIGNWLKCIDMFHMLLMLLFFC
jgi:hypothetical protein